MRMWIIKGIKSRHSYAILKYAWEREKDIEKLKTYLEILELKNLTAGFGFCNLISLLVKGHPDIIPHR